MFTKRSLFLKKHSRRVFIFKHTLPVFAFLFAALLVIWPAFKAEKEKFDIAIQKTDLKTPSIDMENIRFFAHDDKNRFLTVSAEAVKEVDASNRLVRMDKPSAIYTMADGDVVTSQTPYGLAYQNEEYFLFEKKMISTSKSGYTAYTSGVKATYAGIVDSNQPVEISGPAGSLKAQGMHLEKKGNFAHFLGHTVMHIKSEQGQFDITTEDGVVIDQTQKTIVGRKDVLIIHNENHLTADKITLYYQKDSKDKVKKVVAEGQVILDNGKNKITGDKGEYDPMTEKMKMSGDVYLYQGDSFVKSDEATLDMKTGQSDLKINQPGGRIKGTLSPQDLKK